MIGQPIFATLPATQAGHVSAFVNFFPFSYGQALGALDELQHALDELQKDTRAATPSAPPSATAA